MAKKDKEAEDDEKDSEEGEEGEGKKLGGKKLVLIIVLVILLLGGGGAGLYFGGVIGGKKADGEAKEEASGGHGEEAKEEGGHGAKKDAHGGGHGGGDEKAASSGPVFYELPEFLVNLSSSTGKASFLKMKVTMELAGNDPELVTRIDGMKPRIQDAVNTYIRELRASDLSGSAGVYRLREELLTRVNKAIEPDQVKDILFSQLIVQ